MENKTKIIMIELLVLIFQFAFIPFIVSSEITKSPKYVIIGLVFTQIFFWFIIYPLTQLNLNQRCRINDG